MEVYTACPQCICMSALDSTHKGAFLRPGELGGQQVLHRGQQHDDRGSYQRTDPQEVVEEEYADDHLQWGGDAKLSLSIYQKSTGVG